MDGNYQLFDGKVILRITRRICDTPEDLLSSKFFFDVLKNFIALLPHKNSRLLRIFPNPQAISSSDLRLLVQVLRYLTKLPAEMVPQVVTGAETFVADRVLLNDFVEQF